MKKIFTSGISIVILMPTLVYAQYTNIACSQGYTLKCLVGRIIDYFQLGIILIIGLAFLTFVWNVYVYFFTEKDKKEAGLYVLYSVIGFFVILSIWGLVAVLRNTLNPPGGQLSWPFTTSGYSQSDSSFFTGSGGSNTNVPPPNYSRNSEPPPNFNGNSQPPANYNAGSSGGTQNLNTIPSSNFNGINSPRGGVNDGV